MPPLGRSPQPVGSDVVQTLAAGSTTGNGTAVDLGCVYTTPIGQATGTSGITAGAVQLQGSLDGANWYAIGAAVTVPASATVAVPATPVIFPARYLRLIVSTAFAGGSVSGSVGAGA